MDNKKCFVLLELPVNDPDNLSDIDWSKRKHGLLDDAQLKATTYFEAQNMMRASIMFLFERVFCPQVSCLLYPRISPQFTGIPR